MSINNIESKINFEIDNIDPLGQGVSKIDQKIVFIKKTLPGESGTATVFQKKKSVFFAKLDEITKASKERIKPECAHFSECNGCSFLHTNYENEIDFKLNTLARAFKKQPGEISLLKAENRFDYRNRIQLHYDKNLNTIGFYNERSKKIIPINNCMVAVPEIQKTLKDIIPKKWKAFLTEQPDRGHIELYLKDNKVIMTPNESYAKDGFTQVNESMNDQMKKIILDQINKLSPQSIIDLFAGDGNLTKSSNCKNIHFIDNYPHEINENFYNLNLYNAISKEIYKKRSHAKTCDLMVIDPPRSGFQNINDWVKDLAPKHIIYVSCNHQTLARDLQLLDSYSLEQLHLIDLFPSTYHFETIAFLKLK